MLRKIQRRFILAAMAAFGTVMFLIVAGINLANYIQTTSRQDHLAMSLLGGHDRRGFLRPEKGVPPGGERGVPGGLPKEVLRDLPGGGPEAEFIIRFFSVAFDSSGEVLEISRDHISSVDDETAAEYARAVCLKNRDKGYYGDYRYAVRSNGTGCAEERKSVAGI